MRFNLFQNITNELINKHIFSKGLSTVNYIYKPYQNKLYITYIHMCISVDMRLKNSINKMLWLW